MEGNAATPPVLLRVFGALLVLLSLTIAGSYLPLGRFGLVLALGIAGAKALLIVLFFMQVRYKSGLTKIFVGTGVFWLAILFALTLADYLTRGSQGIPGQVSSGQRSLSRGVTDRCYPSSGMVSVRPDLPRAMRGARVTFCHIAAHVPPFRPIRCSGAARSSAAFPAWRVR